MTENTASTGGQPRPDRHVLVVGSLNADLVMRVPHLPQAGETVVGATMQIVAGGKGANQSVAAARLGAAVQLVGRVGADSFGRLVYDEVARAGVQLGHLRVDPDVPTGTAQVVVDATGQNAIVVASGANARVGRTDIPADSSMWNGASIVVLQLEIPMGTVAAAIAMAAARGVPVLLNAAPMQPVPAELLHAVDWLVVNEIEAEQLAGRPVRSPEDAVREARALGRSGQRVVVTLGAAGAVLVHDQRALHVPAPPVSILDTTAAGDALVGGLAAACDRGSSDEEGLREAVVAGSLACTRAGAIPSLPTLAEVRAYGLGGAAR